MIDFAFIWLAFLGMFAIINPFSTAIVFLSITTNDSEEKRKQMAKKAAMISAGVIIVFMISGSVIFNLFSITIEAFKIAGGLLIAKLGFSMLNPTPKQTESEQKESDKKEDISIIPLAIPMLSGPGAITTALVWMSQANTLPDRLILLLVPIVISIIAYFVLVNARILSKLMGHTGINVIEKLMGLIVLVMGIQFILDAIKVIVPTLVS